MYDGIDAVNSIQQSQNYFMKRIWFYIYNLIAYPLIRLLVLISPLLNKKIRESIKGRRKLFENLIINLTGIDRRKKMIWFHSASMGEFEQAKPIIEKLKNEKSINIIVTFFSPSSYNNSLKYPYADVISYLPLDTPYLTSRFLKYVKPNLAIFMRYDFWPNMVWQLAKEQIPYLIVDATMRSNSDRLLPIVKNFHKSLFESAAKIMAVSDLDTENFKKFGINPDIVKTIGDTRYDRVYQKSIEAREKKLSGEEIFIGKKVFILGSSWESDEDIMLPAILKLIEKDKDIIVIIVPHETDLLRIEKIENLLYGKTKSIRFSYLNNYKDEKIIIVDSVGILLTLYKYASVAYVGGSFKQGIHNVLEPAVYGIPVIFGPKIENSQEAQLLVKIGGGFIVRNKKEAYRILRRIFSDEQFRISKGQINSQFTYQNTGATESIIKEINEFL